MEYSAKESPLPAFMEGELSKGLGTKFASIAKDAFYELIPGGKVAFLERKQHKEDESAHARPKWTTSDQGMTYSKG